MQHIMFLVLSNPIFRRLFVAQTLALLGTGLLTIALGLTAYQLAGAQAGQVLGLALTIKMVAYVGVSPVMTALVARLDRRRVMVAADVVRVAAALCLPFVTEIWQVYGLIFVLQAASATFTPTFQATLPEVFDSEEEYTRALSLSRLAYDLETLFSPVLAGLLLGMIPPSGLFFGTGFGFFVSAVMVWASDVPSPKSPADAPFRDRLTRGIRLYLQTPRLRGLMGLNLVISAVGAIVLVQSVVVAQEIYGGDARSLAWLVGASGLGSMLVALALPRVLDRVSDRVVMLCAAAGSASVMTAAGLLIGWWGWPGWGWALALWFAVGACQAAILTPGGRLLRRSAQASDRPAVFAAHFALSHACWLFAYPMAGFLGAWYGVDRAMLVLGVIALTAFALARRLWPPR